MSRHARRRCFIALWAMASLLFGQWVFATHLCAMPGAPVESASHGDEHHLTDCCASTSSFDARMDDGDRVTCQLHCADSEKSSAPSTIPHVPPLLAAPHISVAALVLAAPNGVVVDKHPRLHRSDRNRRVDDFAVLLI